VTLSLCRIGPHDISADQVIEVRLVDEDEPEANPNLDFVLKDLAQSIVSWLEQGRAVLVHCVRAELRTPAVAAPTWPSASGFPATRRSNG